MLDLNDIVTTEAQSPSSGDTPQLIDIGGGRFRPMFPPTIDSTMLAAFRSCPQKMFRTYVEHWKPKTESVHLVAGGAFAKGIEAARMCYFAGKLQIPTVAEATNTATGEVHRHVTWAVEDVPPGNSALAQEAGHHALIATYGNFECPPESAKSLERTAGALDFYFESYPLGEDGMEPITLAGGGLGIEFSFAEPLPGIVHPTTGQPLLYTGRADMIANFAGGVYIVDEKTTSQLGASWPRQWEMRGQFSGYAWAAQQIGIDTAGTVVRGISILKTKYDTLQVPTNRAPWEIDRWLMQTQRDIQRMIQCWQDGWWDYALDSACAEYGGCGLMSICKSPRPDDWLPMNYQRKVWDPLARREVGVAEWEQSWNHGVQG